MKKFTNAGILAGLLLLAACGASDQKKDAPDLAEKKAKLAELKKQQDQLNTSIASLEAQIAAQDSSFGLKPKLVSLSTITTQPFTHYIDLQGRIGTREIYYVAPKGQGGQVRAVYVKEGDHVNKGQLLLKLDDALVQQSLSQLQTQLAFAQDLYKRQQNLWDQKIGTEVQLITAKNNVDNLEKQIATVKEQASMSSVYSEVSGVVETVNIHVGEMFTGNPVASISIVNQGSLKAMVEVPENYLPNVSKGTPVVVEVPDLNKTFNSKISLVSQLINNNSRTFSAEAAIPSETDLKPNQVALIKIQDYMSSNALVIPMTTLQTDENGKYVFVAEKQGGKLVAKKKPVMVGSVYGEKIEVKKGLNNGDQLVTEGFQSLYDGQVITTNS